MVIRVDNLDSLTEDIEQLFGLSRFQLLYDLNVFAQIDNLDERYKAIAEYVEQHQHQSLSEVYLVHITRQLNDHLCNELLPLNKLLLLPNSFSSFLYEHGVEFHKDHDGDIFLKYNSIIVDWQKCDNKGFNVSRFGSRLTKDYCVNGFAFLFDLKNTRPADFNYYYSCPEILQDLDYLLGTKMCSDFRRKSLPYYALCKAPIRNVVFDAFTVVDFETEYLKVVLSFLLGYHCNKKESIYNPILRANDDLTLSVDQWIYTAE